MKDFTASTFGLFIAYVIPGTAVLYALSGWVVPAKQLVDSVMQAQADVGLTIGTLIAVSGLGIIAGVIRALLVEAGLHKGKVKTIADAMANVGPDDNRMEMYQLIIDQQYRYYQCFGGLWVAFLIHLAIFGKVFWNAPGLDDLIIGLTNLVLLFLFTWATLEAHNRYAARTMKLFTDQAHPPSPPAEDGGLTIQADSVTLSLGQSGTPAQVTIHTQTVETKEA